MIEPVDLGICHGYEYQGDPARTAIVLPGRMLAGMPINAFAIDAVWKQGWRAVLVWDEGRVTTMSRPEAPVTLP